AGRGQVSPMGKDERFFADCQPARRRKSVPPPRTHRPGSLRVSTAHLVVGMKHSHISPLLLTLSSRDYETKLGIEPDAGVDQSDPVLSQLKWQHEPQWLLPLPPARHSSRLELGDETGVAHAEL